MLQNIITTLTCLVLIACSGSDAELAIPQSADSSDVTGDLVTGIGMTADELKTHSDAVARDLISTLGQQQTSAILGWQVEPDYWPMPHCFDHWYGMGEIVITTQKIANCEAHINDLSRLYASYGTQALPVLFKSRYYWDQQDEFGLTFPQLVEEWKAAGGSKDDASFLKHPNCAEPLQEGWTGSDFFWDGQENPICRSYKLEALKED